MRFRKGGIEHEKGSHTGFKRSSQLTVKKVSRLKPNFFSSRNLSNFTTLSLLKNSYNQSQKSLNNTNAKEVF